MRLKNSINSVQFSAKLSLPHDGMLMVCRPALGLQLGRSNHLITLGLKVSKIRAIHPKSGACTLCRFGNGLFSPSEHECISCLEKVSLTLKCSQTGKRNMAPNSKPAISYSYVRGVS